MGPRGLGIFFSLLTLWISCATALAAPPAEDASLDLTRFHGQVVVVDFWASWCAPCRRSIPWLNAMQAKYGGEGLVIIGVNVDTDRADAERFRAQTPISFEVIYDPEGRLPAQYQVPVMPSSYVFDRSGALVVRHHGFQNARRAEYEEVLRKLVLTGDNAG